MNEQLKLLGNVIEFPKNDKKKINDLKDKLNVAFKLLEIIISKGYEFSIVVESDAGSEVFEEDKNKKFKDLVVFTSSYEFYKKTKNKIASVYTIKGDEF